MDDLDADLEGTNPFSQKDFDQPIKTEPDNQDDDEDDYDMKENNNENIIKQNSVGGDLANDFGKGFFSGAGDVDANKKNIVYNNNNNNNNNDNNKWGNNAYSEQDMPFVKMQSAYDDDDMINTGKIGSNINKPVQIENNNNNNGNNNNVKKKKKKKKLFGTNSAKYLTHDELDAREKELERRENEIKKKRSRLDNVKQQISSNEIKKDNWPCSCYPITFHSIKQEIPPHARTHMRKMYTLVLITFLTLFWNFCASLALYFQSIGNNADKSILLSIVYLIVGSLGAWKMWYRQIYYGIKDRKTVKWWIFFLFFFAHIGFCITMVIGVQGIGASGFSMMIKAFNAHQGAVGMCVMVSAILWFMLAIASMFQLKKSWNLYKDRGGLEQAQEEFTRAALKHAADQMV